MLGAAGTIASSAPRTSAMTKKSARPRRSALETELVRLEQEPPANRGALAQHLRDLRIAALVADKTGSYVMANPVASRLTGYSVDELRSMSVWDLTLPAKERETDVLWRSFVQAGTQRGTVKLKTKKGAVVSARYVAKSHVLPGLHISLLRRVK